MWYERFSILLFLKLNYKINFLKYLYEYFFVIKGKTKV